MQKVVEERMADRSVHKPAIMRGFAALFKLIVLKTNNSKLKCTSAARKEMRVAPACKQNLFCHPEA